MTRQPESSPASANPQCCDGQHSAPAGPGVGSAINEGDHAFAFNRGRKTMTKTRTLMTAALAVAALATASIAASSDASAKGMGGGGGGGGRSLGSQASFSGAKFVGWAKLIGGGKLVRHSHRS